MIEPVVLQITVKIPDFYCGYQSPAVTPCFTAMLQLAIEQMGIACDVSCFICDMGKMTIDMEILFMSEADAMAFKLRWL